MINIIRKVENEGIIPKGKYCAIFELLNKDVYKVQKSSSAGFNFSTAISSLNKWLNALLYTGSNFETNYDFGNDAYANIRIKDHQNVTVNYASIKNLNYYMTTHGKIYVTEQEN